MNIIYALHFFSFIFILIFFSIYNFFILTNLYFLQYLDIFNLNQNLNLVPLIF